MSTRVEKVLDHRTIGPRKFFEFPENISPENISPRKKKPQDNYNNLGKTIGSPKMLMVFVYFM
jgi:hypothetical protein